MAGRSFATRGLTDSVVAKFGPDVAATVLHGSLDGLVPCGLFVNEPDDGQQPNCEYETPFPGDDDGMEVWPVCALRELTGPVELTVSCCRCHGELLSFPRELLTLPLPRRCVMGRPFRTAHAHTRQRGTADPYLTVSARSAQRGQHGSKNGPVDPRVLIWWRCEVEPRQRQWQRKPASQVCWLQHKSLHAIELAPCHFSPPSARC